MVKNNLIWDKMYRIQFLLILLIYIDISQGNYRLIGRKSRGAQKYSGNQWINPRKTSIFAQLKVAI